MNLKHKVFGFLIFIFSFFIYSFFLGTPSASACTRNPTIINDGDTGGIRSVTYHIKVRNNCADAQQIRIRVSSLPNVSENPGDYVPNPSIQDRLNADWRVNDNSWNNPLVINVAGGSTRSVDVIVRRNIDVYHPDGTYAYVKIRAALVSNTSYSDTLSLVYIVQNQPDLTFTRFEFPGGLTCKTTNAIVRIRNQGWKDFSGNFDVRVYNGNADNGRTHRVTQFVSAREFINLDSQFTNMNLPPPGNWTARAVVDLNNEIREEDERDNEATSSYSTTPCNPIGSHDGSDCNVSTGWTCDPDNYSQPLTVHFYEGGTFLGQTTANQPRPDVPAAGYCGGNPNVGFSFITPEVLKDGNPHSITAYAINIGSGNANPPLSGTPKTITCAPPYKISGGLFLDLNENKIFDGSDRYIEGSINVSGRIIPSIAGVGFLVNVIRGSYSVSSSIPSGYEFTYPRALFPPPPSPSVTVNTGLPPACSTNHEYASCDALGNVSNLNFGIRLTPADPWINGAGGDMRVDNGMKNLVQADNYFSEVNQINPIMDHGVVFGIGLKLNDKGPDAAKANESSWLVTNTKFSFPIVRTSYDEIRRALHKGGILSDTLSVFGDACPGPGPTCRLKSDIVNAVYATNKKVVLESTSGSYTFPASKNFIFLIENDLEIRTDIFVPKGSTVTFIVKGDIIVAPSVERIEGIYSTDNNFITEGINKGIIVGIPDEIDTPLIIAGSVIANAKFRGTPGTLKNSRNLDRLNDTTPAVKIIYRPDFVLNTPELLRYRSYTIREVAPGG